MPAITVDDVLTLPRLPTAPRGYEGEGFPVRRGFETVTDVIDGIVDHQDSNAGGGQITNGDTQWMTAGAGIPHIEAPPESLVTSAACP